jgi:membrane protein
MTEKSLSGHFARPSVMNKRQNKYQSAGRIFGLLRLAALAFKRNQGLLLSGAVAYYTLLSIVPMSMITLVVLSNFIDEQRLIDTLSTYLSMLVPGYAATLTEQVKVFIDNRGTVGVIGFIVMLFFSSIAFSMLESAMSVIFFSRVRHRRRNFFASAVIPYLYICLISLGMLLVSLVVAAMDTLQSRQLIIFGSSLNLEGTTALALRGLGVVGEILMFMSVYLVMPVVRIETRHALVGGIIATFLWEITRRILVWYYGVMSMVNVIYGSIATAVVALLSIEFAVLILLFGAQVIAELESKSGKSTGRRKA